jgi:hypothetical protein
VAEIGSPVNAGKDVNSVLIDQGVVAWEHPLEAAEIFSQRFFPACFVGMACFLRLERERRREEVVATGAEPKADPVGQLNPGETKQ